jgi:hypothetical protein
VPRVAALGTQTLTEVVVLAADALRLLRRHGAALVGWFCLGWATHEIGLFLAALLGVQHVFLANLVFVLAVVAELVALVLMVDVVRPALPTRGPTGDAAAGAASASLPSGLLAPERTLDVVTLAVGPFLAVYAVWGFLDDEVSALFRSQYVVRGLGGVQDWSIGLEPERLPTYLILAAGAFVLRAAVRLLLRRRRSSAVAGVGLVAEGVWALSVFVVLVVVVRFAKDWLQGRLVWAELAGAAQAALSWLPAITLPFGATLREAVRDLVTQAPAVLLTVVGLPLMWLALTAVVYGWREVSVADALGAQVAGRLGRWSRPVGAPVNRVLLLATDDLRTKYLPVVRALRVVARAGPRVVGAYLLLATALASLDRLLQIGVSLLVGPQPVERTLLLVPVEDLVVATIVTTASVALYGAVFARALLGPAATSDGDPSGRGTVTRGSAGPVTAGA